MLSFPLCHACRQQSTPCQQGKKQTTMTGPRPRHAYHMRLTPWSILHYGLSLTMIQGVLIPTHSPYNTPINPVVKADGKTWRLTQDLRAINKLIIPLSPIVPDVPTVINSIPCTHKYFSVIDLCAAFFSVPVHPETQPLLAFTYRGRQYRWTRLAQGFSDSPSVFSAAVQKTLARMTDLPSSVCVLQYADDIMVSAETREDCEKASIIVCNVLADAGFKASKEKTTL